MKWGDKITCRILLLICDFLKSDKWNRKEYEVIRTAIAVATEDKKEE